MHQLIEGIDNEIVFIFFFITLLLAVVIPLYVMKPARTLQERTQEENGTVQTENVDSNATSAVGHDTQDAGHTSEDDGTSIVDTPMPEPPSNFSTHTSDSVRDTISIRVLHQESNRQLDISSETTLGAFKELSFPAEYATHKSIRMIYAGRILTPDSLSLRELGISSGSVLHCVISDQANTSGRTNEPAAIPNELDLSDYFMLLVGVTLVGTWAIFITSSNIMSATSIAILGILTVFFVGMTFYS